jgi:ergothioneine biosynthesis protein EgtB
LVSCGEDLAFMADDGYARPQLWLSEGWDTVLREGWQAPAYWRAPTQPDEPWRVFTLDGLQMLDPSAPVGHLSYYEADAYARWQGARLPTEAEWEHAATEAEITGNLLPTRATELATAPLHPRSPNSTDTGPLAQLFGDVWEWTASPYQPYPRYTPPEGPIGEYNGKFMCNQLVLRGGSCATAQDHVRASYRNFFPAPTRWQFSGLRLAKDLS